MRIIPAKCQSCFFKTVGGDRGDRWADGQTDAQQALSSANGIEISKLAPPRLAQEGQRKKNPYFIV